MKIQFYFDFLSPYSYLAWTWLRYNRKLIESQGYSFELIPVVLAKVIKFYETKGPAEIAPKRNYLLRDCLRFAKQNDIPFETPKKLPFNSQGILRVAEALNGKEEQWEVVDALYRGCWEKGLDLEEDETVINVLNDINFDGNNLIEQSNDRSVRQRIKQNVKEAQEKGIFGLPTFFVNDEIFWGNDSIPSLVSALKNEDLLDREKYNHFIEKHNF